MLNEKAQSMQERQERQEREEREERQERQESQESQESLSLWLRWIVGRCREKEEVGSGGLRETDALWEHCGQGCCLCSASGYGPRMPWTHKGWPQQS